MSVQIDAVKGVTVHENVHTTLRSPFPPNSPKRIEAEAYQDRRLISDAGKA